MTILKVVWSLGYILNLKKIGIHGRVVYIVSLVVAVGFHGVDPGALKVA